MKKFSLKIAFPIIIAGLFIVASFAALNYENLGFPFYVVASLLVIFVFLFGFAMGRFYALPISEFLEKAGQISKGDLKKKVELKTKDEIEELSKIFNKIAEELEKSTSDVETVKKTSDIKLKTKDLVSEKIMDALENKIKNRTADLEGVVDELGKLKEKLKQKDQEIIKLSKGKKK